MSSICENIAQWFCLIQVSNLLKGFIQKIYWGRTMRPFWSSRLDFSDGFIRFVLFVGCGKDKAQANTVTSKFVHSFVQQSIKQI